MAGSVTNVNMFKTQSPYEQQIEELKRRQQMAEMLQQQALQPLESQVAPGGMVVPTSPVLGLTKMLQAYMGGKQLRDIEKQKGELSERSTAEAQDFLRSMAPGAQQRMSPDAALAASLSTAPTEAQPITSQQRQQAIMGAGLSANPQMRMAAQLALMKPERVLQLDKVDPSKFTPASVASAFKADDPTLLVPVTPKPDKPTVAGGMVWDPAQRKFVQIEGYADQAAAIAAAGRAAPAPEAPVAVMGPDGKPVYVNRSQAIGKTPYTATTLKQEQQELDKTRAQTQASLSAQETLDNAAILLQHPGRTGATGKTALWGSVPGTDAYDFSKRLDSFKAQTFIPMVSALKGMGALSDAEGKKLSESVGALDRSMSEDAFAQSLQQIMDSLYNKAQAAGLQVKKPDFSSGATPAPPPPPNFRRQ
jgi:hypothetical protein